MQKSHKLIAIGALALMGAMALGTAAILKFVVLQPSSGPKVSAMLSNSIAAIPNDYEPTSSWMEDGLNPDVAHLDLSDGQSDQWRDLDEEIRREVHSRYNDLIPCYAKALEQEDLAGRVDLRFGIAPDGHVAMVEVIHSELESKPTEDCLVEAARHWTFPETGRSNLTKFESDFTFTYQ